MLIVIDVTYLLAGLPVFSEMTFSGVHSVFTESIYSHLPKERV